jgi:hypothetical protein
MRNVIQIITVCAFIMLVVLSKSTAQTRNGLQQFTPADFDPKKHILLVAEMPRLKNPEERNESVTKKLDKAMKENYPYKYEIVSLKDIVENTPKYADTSIYKYALISSLSSYERTTTTTITRTDNFGTNSHSVSPSANVTSIDFSFYDRVSGIRGPDSGWHSSFLGMTMKKVLGIIKKEKGL